MISPVRAQFFCHGPKSFGFDFLGVSLGADLLKPRGAHSHPLQGLDQAFRFRASPPPPKVASVSLLAPPLPTKKKTSCKTLRTLLVSVRWLSSALSGQAYDLLELHNSERGHPQTEPSGFWDPNRGAFFGVPSKNRKKKGTVSQSRHSCEHQLLGITKNTCSTNSK